MNVPVPLNQFALEIFESCQERASLLKIQAEQAECGTHILDFGVRVPGGIQGGLELARLCLSGLGEVSVLQAHSPYGNLPSIQVTSDHPVSACLLSQYAGWPVKSDDYFAMGSGPMRAKRGREHVLKTLNCTDTSAVAVGVLESDTFPTQSALAMMANECGVPPESLFLAIAPTRSIAGCIQVVARSVETALHKLAELSFPLDAILSASGTAPLPPPIPNFAKGIGRTNDAILYGGSVFLWVDTEDELIDSIGPQVPSCSSSDFGSPFFEIFKASGYDFYKLDPALFSPAKVSFINLRSGKTWQYGEVRPDLVLQSFGLA